MNAADYLAPGGPLARAIPGYEHRQGQMEMARAVEDALRHDGVLMVEAGTGTGKTLAYLIPAIISGRKIIVSTGTRALQDQILDVDIPLLERALGREVDAVALKGLGNYVCRRRYEEFRKSPSALSGAFARDLQILQPWVAETIDGDKAGLADLSEEAPIWAHVISGSDTRIGAKCDFYDSCFVTRARREAERAQIVVVNHHLFFADLALRGPHPAAVLPPYEALIFDEAHHVEDIATQYLGASVSRVAVDRFVKDAANALLLADDRERWARGLDQVQRCAERLWKALPAGSAGHRSAVALGELGGTVMEAVYALDTALEVVEQHCLTQRDADEPVRQLARRAARLREALASVAEAPTHNTVAWLQTSARNLTLGASPVNVGPILREALFSTGGAVVMTSATLSLAEDFKFAKSRLGIDFEIDERVVPSPFAYEEQAALYIADDLPDPRDAQYAQKAADRIAKLIALTGGGALVLCTSRRMMHTLAELLKPQLDLPSWTQGESPKATLLAEFRKAGNGVLFATASFWEGVDVPGDALRLVVIDKLPFDVPNDPVVRARCEGLREQGESPFMTYLVPAAALSLKQGFGRLIRSRADRGVVAVLDSRIATRGYGKAFLKALPPAHRCRIWPEVEAFWRLDHQD